MASGPNNIARFWQELKRRKVIQVIIVYATAAFVILELVNNVFEPLRLPDWTPAMVIVILAIGFPFAVIFSWIFDISLKGIVKTQSIEPDKEAYDLYLKGRYFWNRRSEVGFNKALIFMGLGNNDKAFTYIDKAFIDREPFLCYLKTIPVVDSLRSDPRFIELLKKMGLE